MIRTENHRTIARGGVKRTTGRRSAGDQADVDTRAKREFRDFLTCGVLTPGFARLPPFLGGQAPAPGYCMSLSEDRRAALRERIWSRLPVASDETIGLIARAWALRGVAA